MKRLFSVYHLDAAAHNARIAGEAEEALDKEGLDGKFKNESLRRWQPIHDAHVVATFAESFAGVEASVNELISRPGSNPDIMQFKKDYPGDLIREKSTLPKAQLILRLSDEDEFDEGREPYQSVDLLRKLRNHFIHYRYGVERDSLLDGLEVQRIDTNPFSSGSSEDLGDYLSYNCARWAFFSSIEFLNEFYDRTRTEKPYSSYEEKLRSEIETGWTEKEPNW